jgi:hypothetical protein
MSLIQQRRWSAVSLLLGAPQPLSAKANTCFRDNYELVMQPICVRIEKPLKNSNLVIGALVGKAQEHNSSVRASLSVDFFTEVLVISNQNPILVGRLFDDFIVVHSTSFIVD